MKLPVISNNEDTATVTNTTRVALISRKDERSIHGENRSTHVSV